MNFETTINYKVADLTAVHRVMLENALRRSGIHSGQIFILFELWEQDGLSQIELAKNLRLSPPTINKLVKGLSDSGFIELRRSETDARMVCVYLSEKGVQIKVQVETIWGDLENQISENLTETEKLIFIQLLDKVLLNFYNDTET